MSIDSFQSVGVTNNDVFAISCALIFDDAHLAGECGADGVTDIHLDVQSLVLAAPSGTEVGGDDAAGGRHGKVAEVYTERVGQFGCLVGVSIVPLVIEFCRG